MSLKSLFYKIFYRPLPGFQWFNNKRHAAISKALSDDATWEDKARMARLQEITRWMMLPMTIIDWWNFYNIKRYIAKMNRQMKE